MSEPIPAVRVTQLVKRYGARTAVDGVSFDIAAGEVFALLGPNGAGKTTTIEIVEGFRAPDSGTVRVLGLDPHHDASEVKQRVGIMLQEGGLYPAMTPREALALFARLYPRVRPANELLHMVGLQKAADTRWRRLSGGEKQRLKLALALLPDPQIIFLDEPTAGMDPVARRQTWETIEALRTRGVTVVLTTHYLEEAEHLADRVAIIVHGQLAALDRPQALIARDVSRVTMRASIPVSLEMLANLPSAQSVRQDGAAYVFDTRDAPSLLAEAATAMRTAEIPITELRVGAGSLEDVFMELADMREPE